MTAGWCVSCGPLAPLAAGQDRCRRTTTTGPRPSVVHAASRKQAATRTSARAPLPLLTASDCLAAAWATNELAAAAELLEKAAHAARTESAGGLAALETDERWRAISDQLADAVSNDGALNFPATASAAMAWALARRWGRGTKPMCSFAALEALATREAARLSVTPAAPPSVLGAAESAAAKLSWALTLGSSGASPAATALHASLRLPWAVELASLPHALSLAAVVDELGPTLQRESITLDGRIVPEARSTAWQSEHGHAFEYSGKTMVPVTKGLTPLLAAARDALHGGGPYDAVLVNLYADGKCGMRYHVDPTAGEAWATDTAVVSLGDARVFAFRTTPQAGAEPVHFRYLLPAGSVVCMWGDCFDGPTRPARFQHAVLVERDAGHARPRMSLVYKRRGGGAGPGVPRPATTRAAADSGRF